MIKVLNLIFVFFSITFSGNEIGELISKIEFKGDFFKTDYLNNIYLVDGANIDKQNFISGQKYHYNNEFLGNISSLDVTNPLRILAYYKDFNQFIILDNTLSPISKPVNLDNLNLINCKAVCTSKNGGFWIFDSRKFQLLYFDSNLQLKHKSISISYFFNNDEIEKDILYIEENNNYVYISIPTVGILNFDRYGALINTYPLLNINEFQIFNNKLVYYKAEKIMSYDTKNYNKDELLINSNIINSRVEQNYYFLQDSNSVNIYRKRK